MIVSLDPGQIITTTILVGQGPAGPPGQPGIGGGISAIASGSIGGQRMVVSSGQSAVAYADHNDPTHFFKVVGMTVAAADDGQPVAVQSEGYAESAAWDFVTGEPIFLAANGLLTQNYAIAMTAQFMQCVGHAVSAQRILLRLHNPVDTSIFIT